MVLAPVKAPPLPQVDDSARSIPTSVASRPLPENQQRSPLRKFRLHWSLESVVACIATLASILAYTYWARRGLTLAYTDAISHMEIARHVWFSTTPGLAQLGSSWLPLDHLLMLPFIWIDPLYRSGLAGALPSMLAYVVACVGMAALGRTLFHSTWAGVLAAVAYGANPNLLYLQATPLGESSMLAAAVLSAYFLVRWIQVAARGGRRFRWRWSSRIGAEDLDVTETGENVAGQARHAIARRPTSPQAAKGTILSGLPEVAPLILLAASVCAGTLVRYDGWALALAVGFAVAIVSFLLWGPQAARARLLVFGLLGFAGCVGWLLYNWIIFGDPLDFYRSNYSSQHQQQHIASIFGLPTKGNLLLSLHIYAQTVLDNIGWPMIIAAGLGLITAFVWLVAIPARQMLRASQNETVETSSAPAKEWPLRSGLAWATVISVLTVPFVFNWEALYSGTTIIVTPEVPEGNLFNSLGAQHAYFNDRYGIMMLPLLALCVAALAPIASEALHRFSEEAIWRESALTQMRSAVHRALISGAIVALLLVGLASSVASTPYVLADPLLGVNSSGSHGSIVDADWLRTHYHGGLILASTGAFAAMSFYTDLPDDVFLNESTKPAFNNALLEPQTLATWVIFNTNSSSYDPVYNYLVVRGNTSWRAYYTLVYTDGSTEFYLRNP